jgi:hypothetical protein
MLARRSIGFARQRSPRAQLDSTESFAQQALDGRSGERRVGTQLGQHGLHLTLAKAEVAQRREDLGVGVDALRRRHVTVGRAIRVPKDDEPVAVALDEQLAAMGRAMVHRAKHQKI